MAKTSSATTTYTAWDASGSLPLVLSDGTNSYIYGTGEDPVEQINNSTGTILYLHHDQQGSTRLITSATGTVEGKCSYGAYGTPTCEGTATTPLGYDSQYTDSDTGLIYLRARYYDPATGQFLSVDPQVEETNAVYEYAKDDPLTVSDPMGECATASTAAIIGPHPPLATPEECQKKLNAMRRITNTVKKRIKDLAKDEHELGKAGLETHVKSLNEASRALEKEVKAFKSRGCEETLRVRIPAEVVQLAELRWRVELRPVVR